MQNAHFKLQSVLIIIFVTFIIGFISGVAFTVFKVGSKTQLADQNEPVQNHNIEIAALEEKIKRDPQNSETWTQLGNFYFDHNEYEKAIDAYKKSIQLSPGNPNVLTDLGVMYRRNKQS